MGEGENRHLLDQINYPEDLRKLPANQLKAVCDELRQYIIDVLSVHPGHLGSSLGTVELTVALHYIFNTPDDRIVWDVGHQAYGHKILTGRKERFSTLRTYGGISGFPNPEESEYDAFIAGHASNSISAALGMANAFQLKGEKDRQVIAVIGDGAMTGGLAYEGLNNASCNKNNLLIVLNDNDMAIDENVGGLSNYLVDITTSKTYNRIRYDIYKQLKKVGLIDEGKRGSILRFNNSLKALLTKQHNMFEGFNIRYFGPVDGHDIDSLVRILSEIKDMKGPKILHIKTKKGKGYTPAENSAIEWHAPGCFNKETGQRIVVPHTNSPQLYQDVFGHTLVELAKEDERIVGITPAMPTGCSMTYLMKTFPDRAYDVGIAEAHAVTFAAGLAKEGIIPFCNIYSSFTQRAFDQVIHDVAIQNLHVIFCLDRSGLVGEDGVTHHGIFDMAALRPIPNLTIASPMNEWELRNLMHTAYKVADSPFVIRYPKGKGEILDWKNKMEPLPIGKGKKIKEGVDVAVLSIGPIGNEVGRAIQKLEENHLSVAHYNMIYLKPIDEEILHEVGKRHNLVVTVEDGAIMGGLGTAVMEFMMDNGYAVQVKRIGISDHFIDHGTLSQLHKVSGLDADSIADTIRLMLQKSSSKALFRLKSVHSS